MQNRSNSNLFSRALAHITVFLLITECVGGELSETEAFFNFVKAVDPQNVLRVGWNESVPHPCSYGWKGVICNFQATTIIEIRLESLNLGGVLDAQSLCKNRNLQVLSLANNLIHGSIPYSISNCRRLIYLNVSSNLLSGRLPVSLTVLVHLTTLDISNNYFTNTVPLVRLTINRSDEHSMNQNELSLRKLLSDKVAEPPNANNGGYVEPPGADQPFPHDGGVLGSDDKEKKWYLKFTNILLLGLGVAVLFMFGVFAYCAKQGLSRMAKEKALLKSLADSPKRTPTPEPKREVMKEPEEKHSELVFFVEEEERFNFDDLLEATADLRSQSMRSSLYKVTLKDNAVYAVKRLKKLQVSLEEFGRTMRQIGSSKHPNILALIGFNSTIEEKLLIYRYQINGSVLDLVEDYIEGRREFPWKLRLSIAYGIVRGLDFIYQNSDSNKIIPHGNLKLSNILLDDNQEPLISEYGYSKFLDPTKTSLFPSNGHTAPEKTISEQGDVYSFGIILLELLTGKTVEKSGIDLPKWVKAIIREEWTGEVFDKEVSSAGREYAFPLLNIALKCVSQSPEDRPAIAEVMEKIDEVVNAHEDNQDMSISTYASIDSSPQDSCLLHTVIPEVGDTPGSSY